MGNSPDQFCGYCGKAREPGETACLRCGNPYSEASAGSPGNSQAPTTLSPTEMARRVTQTGQGSTPPPQYSGVMPPVSPSSDNTSSPNYFVGGMPNHFGGVPPVTPLLGNTPPGMPTPKADKKSLPLGKIVIGQGVAIALLLVVLIVVLLGRGNAVPGIASNATATATPAIPATPMLTSTATSMPTATNTPAPIATSTPLPQAGDVLCKVDVGTWSSGSPDWKPANGVLLNDGSHPGLFPTYHNYNGGPTIVPPCSLEGTNNYAVETNIQVMSITGQACFGITVRGSTSNGWQGYNAVLGTCYSGFGLDEISLYGPGTNVNTAAFSAGTKSHTYRVEANGNTIKFFIDGSLWVTLPDNRYLTGSQVGLWCAGVQLEVFSFQVVAL